jgi:hypothetical protein
MYKSILNDFRKLRTLPSNDVIVKGTDKLSTDTSLTTHSSSTHSSSKKHSSKKHLPKKHLPKKHSSKKSISSEDNSDKGEKETEDNLQDLLHTEDQKINPKKISYIWQDMSKEWKTKLMSDNFVIKNCLSDGNCQFRSIETALTNSGYKTNHRHLRNVIAKYITRIENPEFFNIIQNYRIEKQHGEFAGDWDPFAIKNKSDFIKQIKRTGFHFQGDYITLSLISKAIKIDIIILNDDYTITDLSNRENLQEKIIILYYDNNHYQTIGIKKRINVQSIFLRSHLPKELEMVVDKHTFLSRHLQNVCEHQNCKKIQLNKMLHIIQKNIQSPLSSGDKRTILELLQKWLDDQNFFHKIRKPITQNNQ